MRLADMRGCSAGAMISRMSTSTIHVEMDLPPGMARLCLPEGVDRRLHGLLDKQDRGEPLTDDERAEAEGLVDLSDLLSFLRLQTRAVRQQS